MMDFETWFNDWDQTKDPDVRRFCQTAFKVGCMSVDGAEELAAKVRGYFGADPETGNVEIDELFDGDRDLFDLATKITTKVMQPGKAKVGFAG